MAGTSLRRPRELTLGRAKQLRKVMTLPETILWERVRSRRLGGLKFRRQVPMLDYILDFYCTEARLCVEVDGVEHTDEPARCRDGRRDARLAGADVLVLRFPAAEVLRDEALDGVLAGIVEASRPRLAAGPPLAG